MTDPANTERLLAEADSIHGCTKLAAQIIARQLCAKFRELEGERDGMVAKYALVCTERDKAREDAYDLKAEVLAMVNGDPVNARNERAQALTAERDAALAQVAEALSEIARWKLLFPGFAANRPAKGA